MKSLYCTMKSSILKLRHLFCVVGLINLFCGGIMYTYVYIHECKCTRICVYMHMACICTHQTEYMYACIWRSRPNLLQHLFSKFNLFALWVSHNVISFDIMKLNVIYFDVNWSNRAGCNVIQSGYIIFNDTGINRSAIKLYKKVSYVHCYYVAVAGSGRGPNDTFQNAW